MKTSGFTLLELLIVIAILSLLMAIFVPNLLAAQRRANDAAALGCVNEIKNRQAMHLIDTKVYADDSDLVSDYTINCDSGVIVSQLDPSSGVLFNFSVSHIRGTKIYTVSNTALTSMAK